MAADDIAQVLRILAKYAWAAADELAGAEPEESEAEEEAALTPAEQIAEAKRVQAERHAKLGNK